MRKKVLQLPLCAAVFLSSALLYLAASWAVPFYSHGESREALVVQAIVNGGGIILPAHVASPIPSKPPFFHWLASIPLAAGFQPEEVAVRLPNILLGAGGVALASAVAALWYGLRTAVLTAAILGTSLEWLRLATHARVDMTVTVLIVAAVLMWRWALRTEAGPWAVRVGYLLAAAATLTKGPVGLVLPFLISVVSMLVERAPSRLRRLFDGPGLLLAFLICATWYGLAWREGGQAFIQRQVIDENIGRYLGVGHVPHSHSVLYYGPALLGGFFPWSLLLPFALHAAWRRGAPSDRFLLTWIATVLGFYALATGKRSAYLLPLFPPLAIVTGRLLANALTVPAGRWEKVLLSTLGSLTVLATPIIVFTGTGIVIDALEPWIAPSDLGRLPVVLDVLDRNRIALVIALATLTAGLAVLARRKGSHAARVPVASLCLIAVVWALGFVFCGTYPTAHTLSPWRFADRVRATVDDDDLLWACGHVSGAFRYYVKRPLPQWHPAHDDGDRRSFVVGQAQEQDWRRRRDFVTRQIELAHPSAPSLLELDEVHESDLLSNGKRGQHRTGSTALPLPQRKGCHNY